MTTIVPRWEWRTFGRSFGTADAAFDALTPGAIQESDETYDVALGDAAPATIVKIRGGLIDVKALREVSIEGLERWEPVIKLGFPVAAADVARVDAVLGLARPAPAADVATPEALLAGWSEAMPDLRPVGVHKRRVRYTIEGCTAERTDLVVDGHVTRTIAIESEDAAAVTRAIASVGLDGYVNTNYARAIPAILEDRPIRYAVIDVGTNSIKFHIAERPVGGDAWRTVVDRAEMTRLGEGIERTGEIAPAALERSVAALRDMVLEARDLGVTAIAAVGTAGLRAARNRSAVLAAIRAGAGVTIDLVSGEEEGRLAHHAVQASHGASQRTVVVFETGGGSSQFTFGRGIEVDERFSVPVGAVGYTERFGLSTVASTTLIDEACAAIAADLSSIAGRPRPDTLLGMGGAVTNMAAVERHLSVYDPEVIEGTVLDRGEVERQIDLYAGMDAEDRRTIVGLQPQRAEVILAGACIVRTVMDLLDQTSMTISTHGLRHGLLKERFGG